MKQFIANLPRLPRLLAAVLAVSIVGGLLLVWIWNQIPRIGEEETLGSNIGVVLLINANIVLVMLLGFVVVRNLVKLLLDRRRGIPGARLRTRLVAAFVGLSLIPTVLLFLVAKGIVGKVLQDWFSPQVNETIDAALEISRLHYRMEEQQLRAHLHGVERTLREGAEIWGAVASVEELSKLQPLLVRSVKELAIDGIELLSTDGVVVQEALRSAAMASELPPPSKTSIQQALLGGVVVEPEEYGDMELLRAYGKLVLSDNNDQPFVVVLSHVMPQSLSPQLETVVSNYDNYKELRSYKTPIVSSYYLTLVIVTLLIVFSAIWVGFYLAKGLSGPIHELASGTVEVAHGNLDYRIPEIGDDELGLLVNSFNRMTSDLKSITGELVARRRYMETVLEGIGVGVISVDPGGQVTTVNSASINILSLAGGKAPIGQHFRELFPDDFGVRVEQMLSDLIKSPEKMFMTTLSLSGKSGLRQSVAEMSLNPQSGLRQLAVTINKLVDERGEVKGAVMLFDDVTTLVSAQRVAAWREVARRIAHEIKNPLTPLQLSAQRLQRKLISESGELSEDDRKVIADCSGVIVRQVETLRNLIDEFSKFARLPKTKLTKSQLNPLINQVAEQYQRLFPEIAIDIELTDRLPPLQLDEDQLQRVLTNLFDNAIASLHERSKQEGTFTPRLIISTAVDDGVGLALLRIADNGIGILDEEKRRVFEPYFSKKMGGTGLGLAIVNHIIADHGAFIRVYDTDGGGATFVIEFPIPDEVRNQNRLGGVSFN